MGQETETMRTPLKNHNYRTESPIYDRFGDIMDGLDDYCDEMQELYDENARLQRERDEARQAYEAETLSTAELAAENLRLEKRWKTDNFYFCGMMQLLKEHGIAHGSKDLIAAGRRYEESESQRIAAESADDKPDGQAENA